jgi:hypothetical protein
MFPATFTGSEVGMQKALDIAAVVLAALLVVGLAVVSVRGLIDPQQASLRFGFPVSDAAGALFYRVYLSRNLVIVAASAVFLIRRQWTLLAVLLTAAAVLPAFDMTVLTFDGVAPPAFHKLALALLAIAAALLWRLSHVSKS